MRYLTPALLSILLLPATVFAQNAQTVIVSQFTEIERVILAAVLSDPKEAQAFQAEAAAAEGDPTAIDKAVIRLRAKLVFYANDYVNRKPKTNPSGKTVRQMVEPGEWAALMQNLRQMEPGLTKDIVLRMIKSANENLKEGDNGRAFQVIKLARGKIADGASEYLTTDLAKNAPDLAEKLAREDAAAKAAKQAIADAKKRQKALEQAKRARKIADQARRSRQIEDAKGKSGQSFGDKKEDTPVVVVDKDKTKEPAGDVDKMPPPKRPNLTLQPSKPKKPSKAVIVPLPSTSSDEDELAEMDSGTGGSSTVRWGLVGGGAVIGGLLGLFFGPVGVVAGLIAGAAAGWLASKKLLPD